MRKFLVDQEVKRFMRGTTWPVGGIIYHSKDRADVTFVVWVPAWHFWRMHYNDLIRRVGFGLCGGGGIYFRYKQRYWEFFWRPYSPYYIDKEGICRKSKRFSWITFDLSEEKEEKKMDENNNTEMTPEEIAALMEQLAKEDGQAVVQKAVQTEEETTGEPVVM